MVHHSARNRSVKIATVVPLVLLSVCSSGLGQTDTLSDVFPLRIGNTWTYEFYTSWSQSPWYREEDRGVAEYRIDAMAELGDSTTWHFVRRRDFIRKAYPQTGPSTTTPMKDSSGVTMVELRDGSHRVYTPTYDKANPFPFRSYEGSENWFFRYHPVDSAGNAVWILGAPLTSPVYFELRLRVDTGVVRVTGQGYDGTSWQNQHTMQSFSASPYTGPHMNTARSVPMTSLVGIPKDTVLILENDGIDTLRIQGLTTSDSSLVVSFSSEVIPPFQGVFASVQYTSPFPGERTEYFRIESNAVSSPDTIALTFSNSIAGAAIFEPLSFAFLNVNVLWKYKDAPLTITNIGNAPLTFDSISSTNSDFSVLLDMSSLGPGETRNCTVRYTPTPPFFVQEHGEIVFYTNSLWSPDTLQVTGDAWGARFYFDPTSIDFGEVKLGEHADTTITVSHAGWASVGLLRDVFSDSSFSGLGPSYRSCVDCGTFSDTLRFAPTRAGIIEGYVVYVTNNGTTVARDTIWLSGSGVLTSVGDQPELPREFALRQNYPNPFNPTTTITFDMPSTSDVTLRVFDLLGREVAVLVHEKKEPGYHQVIFDASGLSSGAYFYRLQAGDFVAVRKLIVLR